MLREEEGLTLMCFFHGIRMALEWVKNGLDLFSCIGLNEHKR